MNLRFLKRNRRTCRCALAVLFSLIAFSAATVDAATTLQLGDRTIQTTDVTADGVPVVPSWTAALPAGELLAPSRWSLLRSARHDSVWEPSRRAEGAYNHYSALIRHAGRFYALWANHLLGEDCAGQRVLFATSGDGRKWSTPRILFDSPGPMHAAGEPGLLIKPDRWIATSQGLFAVVYMHGTRVYPIARAVDAEGGLGEPFLLRELPQGAALPCYMSEPRVSRNEAESIRASYVAQTIVSWWSHVADEGVPGQAIDGARLMEPFSYLGAHGPVLCMRSAQSSKGIPAQRNRIYVSFADREGNWSTPYPSDIPDAPSRAQALSLADGRVILAGNQIAWRFDAAMHLRRDPLTLSISSDGETFDRVYALRAGAPSRHRFSGITGRGIGFSYPSMILHEGMIHILYSINKEAIAVTHVPLSAIRN